MTARKCEVPAVRSKKFSPDVVTIREIEELGPCRGEYLAFLRAIKSNPTDGRRFFATTAVPHPQYGPDDPIPLEVIYKTKAAIHGMLTGPRRVAWIIDHVARIRLAVEARREQEVRPLRKERDALQRQVNALDTRIEQIATRIDAIGMKDGFAFITEKKVGK